MKVKIDLVLPSTELHEAAQALQLQLENDLEMHLGPGGRGWHEFLFPHPLVGFWVTLKVLSKMQDEAWKEGLKRTWDCIHVNSHNGTFRFMVTGW